MAAGFLKIYLGPAVPNDAHLESGMSKRRHTEPGERARTQIRRILLLVDTLAPYRYWRTPDEILAELSERLDRVVSKRTIERDLALLRSLGMAERRPDSTSQWRVVLRSSERIQEAAIRIVETDPAEPPPDLGRKVRKLTEEKAQAILDAEGSNRELARRYGVTGATVWQIKNRKIWRHLTPTPKRSEAV